MKVAIIGTRGIPNNYGGFEQCAEYLALGLVARGIDTTVYNWSTHPYQESTWKGVRIVHCYCPTGMGEFREFIYDFNCIRHASKCNYDVILQLGYTSNSIWWWMYPKTTAITTNMDGFEWQRTRRSKPVRNFIKWSESLAARTSPHLIADSIGIQTYLKKEYGKESVFIPYGAIPFEKPELDSISKYGVTAGQFNMLIARILPENNIEMILDGVVQSGSTKDFLVVGGTDSEFGNYLTTKYAGHQHIRFMQGIYNIDDLNNLRYFSNLYFHGHTVGGTNPSLLEAMASSALICAHDNVYNSAVLGTETFYFKSVEDVASVMRSIQKNDYQSYIEKNMDKIRNIYSWDIVTDQYLSHFMDIAKKSTGNLEIRHHELQSNKVA
jgi:glycosyltransferase involved in cell wall biosynthesis